MPSASSDNIETSFNNPEWGYKGNTAINIPPESSDSEETRFDALQWAYKGHPYTQALNFQYNIII
jgi:hypothetical protein